MFDFNCVLMCFIIFLQLVYNLIKPKTYIVVNYLWITFYFSGY